MVKLKKIETNAPEPSTPSIPPGAKADGSGPLLGNRSVRFSPAKQEEKKKEEKRESRTLAFQCKKEQYANDDRRRAFPMPRLATALSLIMIMGVAVGMNASTIATQAVLRADDQLLLSVMEANPDALAHILNAVDVGE